MNPNSADKIVLITGASAGIGKSMAAALAESKMTVVMVSRSLDRLKSAQRQISSANPRAKTDLIVADLSEQAQIKQLASEFSRRYDHLDVLINNAAVLVPERGVTGDGIEMTFAVNHLGYFLLTDLLLDLLKSSAPARIINVASAAHKVAGLDLNDLQMKSNYRGFLAYCNSKLENIMFTYELDRQLRGSDVTANCFHPGGIATDLYRDQSGLVKFLTRLFLRGPDQGARSGIYLAKSAELNGVSGKYYVGKNPVRSSKQSYDTAAQQQLWNKSAELVGLAATEKE